MLQSTQACRLTGVSHFSRSAVTKEKKKKKKKSKEDSDDDSGASCRSDSLLYSGQLRDPALLSVICFNAIISLLPLAVVFTIERKHKKKHHKQSDDHSEKKKKKKKKSKD